MEAAEAQPSEEKKGLKTVWNRVKDFFREKPTATQISSSATTTPPVPAAAIAPQREGAADTLRPSVPSNPPKTSSLNLHREPPTEHSPELEVDDTSEEPAQPNEPDLTSPQEPVDAKKDTTAESHMRFTKAQAIFARHNLELDEAEWEPRYRGTPERVYKNIRMRVRYTCHNCSTTFGRDRICVGCQHRRCTRCSRYPPKKDRTKYSQDPTTTGPAELVNEAPRPSAEGGTCHECRSGFEVDAEECPNCHHKICERCVHEATITVEPGHGAAQEASQEASEVEQPQQRNPAQQESSAVS
ncbi:uncharacterized protein Z520_00492 [Fonsecaea multimorphosa CBS 102226]|uniref:Uncharacterized protein n=1 Tax=Fonsecaea multimorphosa CBS 102226 TaxID=1442371 RepID=A0A0D2HPP5_9EURO|nr:uncharacterized protein Z520_00492 [Fonsecaea multimorphosa CBS 102226]KIY03801.1 hypothetical protein Z520_00492 [Fonsecaea multimorphosa CBS 102226]OAL32493.1 hypothetical protein AYO22_00515 [Fonsecaea multimorphosa]